MTVEHIDRRAFLSYFSAAGLGGTLLPGALWTGLASAEGRATPEMVAAAEKLAGLSFTDEERIGIARGINRLRKQYEAIRGVSIPNGLPPALEFNPEPPGFVAPEGPSRFTVEPGNEIASGDDREFAFGSLRDLAASLRSGGISSEALTRIALDRLKRFDPQLECVVNLTGERALERAAAADAKLKAGDAPSLLHGIPWGAKDLLAVKGYPTTWGAMPFKDQRVDYDAAVVEKLDAAGAVLVAKLTLGALAQGDIWYGGRTNSPWNLKRGASGSSAGPGAATAAGLVAFSIGSETNGSIISPATVCGLTGLRPTFGRVSRHGAMALSWSMDKLGPMCRSAEDCAIVFNEIHGRDERDPVSVDRPFAWEPDFDPADLKVGYVEEAFSDSTRASDADTLTTLEGMGFRLIPIRLPETPSNELSFILNAEAAAAFDDLTRGNRDDLLVNQSGTAWPNTFRTARMIPAVEYIRANRVRTLLIREMATLMEGIDLYVTPTMHKLFLTNLTGHPMLCMPSGFSERKEPYSIGLVGRLYGEQDILAVAKAFQDQTDYHRQRPPIS